MTKRICTVVFLFWIAAPGLPAQEEAAGEITPLKLELTRHGNSARNYLTSHTWILLRNDTNGRVSRGVDRPRVRLAGRNPSTSVARQLGAYK
jgi:hypothetical protein